MDHFPHFSLLAPDPLQFHAILTMARGNRMNVIPSFLVPVRLRKHIIEFRRLWKHINPH